MIGGHCAVRTPGLPFAAEVPPVAAGAAEVLVGADAVVGVVGVVGVVVTVGVVVGVVVVSATGVFLLSSPPLTSRITITITAATSARTAKMRPQRGPLRPGRRLGVVAVAFAALAVAAAFVPSLAGAFDAGVFAADAFEAGRFAALFLAAGFFAADFRALEAR